MKFSSREAIVAINIYGILPHLFRVPLVISICCVALLIWAWGVSSWRWKKPRRILKYIFTLAAFGLVIWQFRTFMGIEAGAAFLALIASLKLFEQNFKRVS